MYMCVRVCSQLNDNKNIQPNANKLTVQNTTWCMLKFKFTAHAVGLDSLCTYMYM